MQDINDYIEPAIAGYMRDAITGAGGNEVFFVGAVGEGRRLTRAEAVARGDESAVPAIAREAAVGDVVIHNHPTGALTPSGADLDVASMLGSRGVGFFIVDNDVRNIYVVVEPFAKEALKQIPEEEVTSFFSDGGALSGVMDGYESRPGQAQMALDVTRAFNNGKVACLEAGTGVGKSMAYLVPSLLWALGNKERVVISTNTINLQEQLIGKDIPLLGRATKAPFKAALVKGRGNYLCMRKLAIALTEGEFMFEPGEKAGIEAIRGWADKTKEGSLSDLNFVPGDELWDKLHSESDTCTRVNCPYFTRCFFFRARREAAAADLLVVNHHILLADIALRSEPGSPDTGILPGYSRLIVDEGHNLEDGATSYFGSRVSRLGLLKTLGRLHSRRERERGVLPYLQSQLAPGKKGRRTPETVEQWRSLISGSILVEKESASARINEAFDMLYSFAQTASSSGDDIKMRLKDTVRLSPGWSDVDESFARACQEIGRLVRSLESLRKGIAEIDGLKESLADPLIEMKALAERLDGYRTALEALLRGDDDGLVKWVEAPGRKGGRVISICGSPLDVAAEMKTRVYDRLKTVVITSATLTVKRRFDFIMKRVGLDLVEGDRVVTGIFPSPFDYQRQVLIGIPTDIPEPTAQNYVGALGPLVLDSLLASSGRAFVLFTSYRTLNQVYKELQPKMEHAGISCMKQGELPRHQLVREFKRRPSAALFATDSFWEGVDVMGEALSNVIITKLPFSVPDDPVVEARQEEIARRGGNAFMEYVVPQAVIKFRQGFGRLIRSKSDRGSIMVFDKRVVEKNYGREFLGSLPEGRVVTGPWKVTLERVREFFAEEDAINTR